MIIDAHTHMTELSWNDLEMMSLAGIREVVSPVNFVSSKPVEFTTIRDVWDFQLDVQMKRALTFHIKAHALIGVSMVSIPLNYRDLLKILPQYLERSGVVGIGEIGFEPASKCCPDLDVQEEVLLAQLRIAKDMKTPVVIHTPNNPEQKILYTKKVLEKCVAVGLDLSTVAIDHSSEANIQIVLDAGAKVGISVQPWRGMSPGIAASIVKRYGSEHIILNSDSSALQSDPLAVARSALALQNAGVPEQDIKNVCLINAQSFYRLEQGV